MSKNTNDQNNQINSLWQKMPPIPIWLIAVVALVFVAVICIQLLNGGEADFWGLKVKPPQKYIEPKQLSDVKSELESLKAENALFRQKIDNQTVQLSETEKHLSEFEKLKNENINFQNQINSLKVEDIRKLKEDVERLNRRQIRLNILATHHFDMRSPGRCQSYFKTLANQDNVICALTGITGGYNGDGEFAKVVSENGVWNFRGSSCQPYVEAWVACFKIE